MRRDAAPVTPVAAANTSMRCEVGHWSGLASTGDSAPAAHPLLDAVVEETAIALVYNGISHAVMLATPADIEDFALGFSLSEGIVRQAAEVYDMDTVAGPLGIEVHLRIAAERMVALKHQRRALAGRTGCGLCGVESLDHALRPVAHLANTWPQVAPLRPQALAAAWTSLAAAQPLHQATGAAHAAGFADWQGQLLLVREDVGRHNALDKLVGAMANQGLQGHEGFALVTSRASYEMVHKAAAAGIPLLAALSAPTAMAVRNAQSAGMTLLGFAGRAVPRVYAHAHRLGTAALLS